MITMTRPLGAAILLSAIACLRAGGQTTAHRFEQQSWAESAEPVRPGVPGKTPFWNAHAKRFIYAPAFDYKPISGAARYQYRIVSLKDQGRHTFEAPVPYAPLSKVWAQMPVSRFTIEVVALSAKGDSLGVAGKGEYYRAAPFNGVYHEPVMPYGQSARTALDNLLQKDYVQYWLKNKTPDPSYGYYRYPAKIYSALVVGAITHARLSTDPARVKQSTELARIIADYLISISYNAQSRWPNFPPTYYGPRIGKNPESHMQLQNNLTIMGADAGNAYLDLYDWTKEEKYLAAARRIADTYLKTQLPSGTWYIYVNHLTGEPLADNLAIPTAVINYFDRLRKDYHVPGLEKATGAALSWVMNNPVKTFNWSGQFEDVKALPPYRNLSREQACDLAVYLFKNKRSDKASISLAEELVRFCEDQFVTWEQADDFWVKDRKDKDPGWHSTNWITPSVHEQYVFWMPVNRSAGIMIDTYWQAYAATHKEIYLAKARSIANAITLVQKENQGDYPTMFISTPWNFWLNSTVYPAKVMMELEKNVQAVHTGQRR